MHWRVAVVGSRGRVTLPPEVRRALGVADGDPVFFLLDDAGVRLTRAPGDLNEYMALHGGALSAGDVDLSALAGSVMLPGRHEDADEEANR